MCSVFLLISRLIRVGCIRFFILFQFVALVFALFGFRKKKQSEDEEADDEEDEDDEDDGDNED